MPLPAHPAQMFGGALAADAVPDTTPDLRGVIAEASDDANDAIHANDGSGIDGLEPTPAPTPAPLDADDTDASFMDRLNAVFAEKHPIPAGETTPVTPAADDAPEGAPEPEAPEAPASAPAAPAAAVDPDVARALQLDAYMRSLSPEQIAAMQRAVENPALVFGGAPATPTAVPTAPTAPVIEPSPRYNPDDFVDPQVAAILNQQAEQIDAFRSQLVEQERARIQAQQDQVGARVIAARDAWAAEHSISAEALARIENMPQTHALLRQLAQTSNDYEAITRQVLDSAVWLDLELRNQAIASAVAQHAEQSANDLARVRQRKAVAAQATGVSGGSAPRVEPVDVSKLPKAQRDAAAVEFLAGRMEGGAA